MRIALLIAIVAVVLGFVALSFDYSEFSLWIINQQRAFQVKMSSALFSLRSGEISAYLALFAATGGYGFVHALGPGHGKYLVGGVGLGSSVTVAKLVGLAVGSSILQALWAIALVYGGFALLQASAERLEFLSEDVLAPASYVAIGIIGMTLTWRGIKALAKRWQQGSHVENHSHHHHEGCGHNHGPSPEEAANVRSIRDAIVLMVSIAVRPCTGAVFLLIIAWQANFIFVGAAAVVFMGLGTALLTGLVAVSSVSARRMALFSADSAGIVSVAFPAAQILAGSLILLFSALLLSIVY